MRFTSVLVGVPEVVGNIQQLYSAMTRQANTSAWNGAQHLKARSQAVVPYLDGELYDSAYINKISNAKEKPVWVVGYDTVAVDYAVMVHEIPNRIHPTRGPSREAKQDHYLSEPRDAMESSFPRTVKRDMEDIIRQTRFSRRVR